MATKTLFPLGSDLIVTLKTQELDALSFSVHMKSFIKYLSLFLFAFLALGIGTLLFLRELEKSRKLEDRLLQMEIKALLSTQGVAVATRETNVSIPLAKAETPVAVIAPPKVEERTTPSENFVGARVQDLSTDCVEGICSVQLSLIPSQTGVAQGELLVILEAEVPRIGTSNTASQVRKRFFFYPHNEARDEMTDAQVPSLKRKAFRFGRALQTSTEFNIGEVLRPIAVNLYLYDARGEMIHHERKAIQNGDGDVE